MNEFELDKSIDLDELKRQADALTQAKNNTELNESNEETEIVGSDWMNKPRRVKAVDNREEENQMNSNTEENIVEHNTTNEYSGPGLVIEKETYTEEIEDEHLRPGYTGITPETQSNIDKYLQEMDEEIAEAKEKAEQNKIESDDESDDDDESSEDGMTSDEFNDKYEKAVVVIDKTNFGHVINFTEEERNKLEKSNVIKLEEIETVSLQTIKTKKVKKKTDFNKIIKKISNITTTSIVLPISGYVAEMKGCSAYELISLIGNNDNALLNAQNRWSVIHEKMENSSIGKMDFNEFLLNTAAADYETLIYGILCSTYPEDGSITVTCDKCKKKHDHTYSVKSLIRAEEMEPELLNTFMNIVDNSVSVDDAKNVHEKSLLKQVKRIKLPMSGIIAEIYVQSAYDLINKSIKSLNENKDSKYNDTSVISTLVNNLYIPDPDDPGSYFEVDDALDIAKTLYSMNEKDIMIIRKIGENAMKNMSVNYGIMNINCPYCKKYTSSMPINVEDILFFRYQQALSTEIE